MHKHFLLSQFEAHTLRSQPVYPAHQLQLNLLFIAGKIMILSHLFIHKVLGTLYEVFLVISQTSESGVLFLHLALEPQQSFQINHQYKLLGFQFCKQLSVIFEEFQINF